MNIYIYILQIKTQKRKQILLRAGGQMQQGLRIGRVVSLV